MLSGGVIVCISYGGESMKDMVCSFGDKGSEELEREILEIEMDGDEIVLSVDGHRIWIDFREFLIKLLEEIVDE